MASAQSTVESGCCRIRYLLLIEYVGTAFHGSQRQPGKRTVQELVEDAAAKLTPHSVPPTVVFAGRTDAGVHSIANAAHVDLERLDKHGNRLPAFSEGELMNALNNFVGERCGIVSARRVHKGFHARHSARVRTYVYQIRCPKSPREARAQALLRVDCCGSLMRRGWVSAHDAHRSLWLAEPLDLNAMRDAAALLVGKHDFSAFRAVRCGAKSPVRDLLELAVVEDSPSTLAEFDLECTRRVALRLRARSFLHHQVRYIAATLVEVGLGKRSLQQVRDMLRSADSRQSPPIERAVVCAQRHCILLAQSCLCAQRPSCVHGRCCDEWQHSTHSSEPPAPAHGLYMAHVEYPESAYLENVDPDTGMISAVGAPEIEGEDSDEYERVTGA